MNESICYQNITSKKGIAHLLLHITCIGSWPCGISATWWQVPQHSSYLNLITNAQAHLFYSTIITKRVCTMHRARDTYFWLFLLWLLANHILSNNNYSHGVKPVIPNHTHEQFTLSRTLLDTFAVKTIYGEEKFANCKILILR